MKTKKQVELESDIDNKVVSLKTKLWNGDSPPIGQSVLECRACFSMFGYSINLQNQKPQVVGSSCRLSSKWFYHKENQYHIDAAKAEAKALNKNHKPQSSISQFFTKAAPLQRKSAPSITSIATPRRTPSVFANLTCRGVGPFELIHRQGMCYHYHYYDMSMTSEWIVAYDINKQDTSTHSTTKFPFKVVSRACTGNGSLRTINGKNIVCCRECANLGKTKGKLTKIKVVLKRRVEYVEPTLIAIKGDSLPNQSSVTIVGKFNNTPDRNLSESGMSLKKSDTLLSVC
jgi:hypothetical protein